MAQTSKIDPTVLYFPPAIQAKLQYLQKYPLTVLCAPAGFGKTTAVKHFLKTKVSPKAQVWWHTFFPSPTLAAWKEICTCIGKVDPHYASQLLALGLPSFERAADAAELLGDITCTQETYLVLDSFEYTQLPEPELFLSQLAQHGSPHLHIILITREITFSKLRASHHIYQLSARDFAFTAEDIQAYFKRAGLQTTPEETQHLQKITNGWILALYMQMQTYINHGHFSSQALFQPLQDEVWGHFTPKQKDFFLRLSIFPHFTLSQACQITQWSPEETEKLLTSQVAFIPFDQGSQAFYFHTIFADFLKNQFQNLPREQQQTIYLAGGDVANQTGERMQTLFFYYYSGHWERIYAMPLTSYDLADISNEKSRPIFLRLLEDTPEEIKRKYPAALIPLAFTLFFLGEHQKLAAMKDDILRIIHTSELPESQKNELLGEMDLLLSFLLYNRIDQMSLLHRRALHRLQKPAALINMKSTWTFGSPSVLYMFWRESGKLDEELCQMDECMPIYYQLTHFHGYGAEHIMRAEAHFMRGECSEAKILCYQAMAAARSQQQSSILFCILFLLARMAFLEKDQPLFWDCVQQIKELALQNNEDLCRYTKDLALGYLSILLGKYEDIAPWLQEGEIDPQRLAIMTQPFAFIIYGRYLLFKKEYSKLWGVCQHLMEISSIFPNLLPQVYGYLYMAQAQHALGNVPEALNSLKTALKIALPDRLYMPFAENFSGLHGLFNSIFPTSRQSYLKRMENLAAYLIEAQAVFNTALPILTEREREIYELIKQGVFNNTEIAQKLGISLSTVKTHIGRIYAKSGVSSKAQLLQTDF